MNESMMINFFLFMFFFLDHNSFKCIFFKLVCRVFEKLTTGNPHPESLSRRREREKLLKIYIVKPPFSYFMGEGSGMRALYYANLFFTFYIVDFHA